jgi:N-acetylmuramoyl-L-alanine amidase
MRPVVVFVLALLGLPSSGAGQGGDFLVNRGAGSAFTVPVSTERGFSAVPDELLSRLGWRVERTSTGLTASLGEEAAVALALASPVFRWNDDLLQFIGEPYVARGSAWIPLQLILDFLPSRLPDRYQAPAGGQRLDVLTASGEVPALEEPGADTIRGVVVIDPGHGGRDSGAVGPGGRREKDIALAIGRALARELEEREDLEVWLTRDRDEFVPIWDRGRMATAWKGDRPGVFISIHVNSFPGRGSVRGFETYFLSEARTEHERRVVENENAPLDLEQNGGSPEENPDLDFILRELRNRDYQRWSSVLAGEIQRMMEDVHPGPNRGVKQGPLAVITNALMPAVLVEVGFVTNRAEERLLSRGEFQRKVAGSIAEAVDHFLDRYPPGGRASGSSGR